MARSEGEEMSQKLRYKRPALTPEQVEILRHVGAGVALFGLMFAGLALALAL